MIYGLMVVKDEEERYLQSSLRWASRFLDLIFVYDDISLDNSAGIAAREGAVVAYRDDSTPTFMENEGLFREGSWKAFESKIQPTESDWVLAFDADDFFVGTMTGNPPDNQERVALEDYMSFAEYIGKDSVYLKMNQVWKNDHSVWTRQDGWWAKDRRPQFFRYRPNGTMVRKAEVTLGTGCWPTYATKDPLATVSYGSILHYGYAKDEDKQEKYDRYMGKIKEDKKKQLHSSKHVKSIIETPKLVEWKGNVPKVWTGPR
jgi:hypothetical protein